MYESFGLIMIRDSEKKLFKIQDLKNNDGRKTSNEFIVPWSDCWDIDDAELVDKKVD